MKTVYWKFCFGLIILVFIIFKIDLNQASAILQQVSWKNFLTVLYVYLLSKTLSAYKWAIISNHIGFTCTVSQYLRLYFQGMFYNQFLPTGIGGDIIKGYFLYQHDKNHLKPDYAAATILFDRLSGIFVLLTLLLPGCLLHFKQLPVLVSYIMLAAIGGAAVCAMLIACLSYRRKIFKNKLINRILFLTSLYLDKTFFKIFAISLVFHFMALIIHTLIGWDLNLKVTQSYYLILYPATAILASLPISLNGLGIREWAYVFFLGLSGIASPAAFVFALYWGLILLAASLTGAIFLINWNKNEISNETPK